MEGWPLFTSSSLASGEPIRVQSKSVETNTRYLQSPRGGWCWGGMEAITPKENIGGSVGGGESSEWL